MITYNQFKKELKFLCLKECYETEKNPSSVDRIIFNRPKYSSILLLKYYLQEYIEPARDTLEDGKIIDITKFKSFVYFIRYERNKMFPNSYSTKPRKFISKFGYYKSTPLSQYIEYINKG